MSKSTNRRESIAIALAVLGVAGLSLASAAQLNLTGTASVQSGVVTTLNADCQAAPITVTFSAPVVTTAAPKIYASANVNLAGIEAPCLGKNYKLALLDSSGLFIKTAGGTNAEVTGKLDASNSAPLTIAIPVGTDNDIKNVALTIYS